MLIAAVRNVDHTFVGCLNTFNNIFTDCFACDSDGDCPTIRNFTYFDRYAVSKDPVLETESLYSEDEVK